MDDLVVDEGPRVNNEGDDNEDGQHDNDDDNRKDVVRPAGHAGGGRHDLDSPSIFTGESNCMDMDERLGFFNDLAEFIVAAFNIVMGAFGGSLELAKRAKCIAKLQSLEEEQERQRREGVAVEDLSYLTCKNFMDNFLPVFMQDYLKIKKALLLLAGKKHTDDALCPDDFFEDPFKWFCDRVGIEPEVLAVIFPFFQHIITPDQIREDIRSKERVSISCMSLGYPPGSDGERTSQTDFFFKYAKIRKLQDVQNHGVWRVNAIPYWIIWHWFYYKDDPKKKSIASHAAKFSTVTEITLLLLVIIAKMRKLCKHRGELPANATLQMTLLLQETLWRRVDGKVQRLVKDNFYTKAAPHLYSSLTMVSGNHADPQAVFRYAVRLFRPVAVDFPVELHPLYKDLVQQSILFAAEGYQKYREENPGLFV